MRRPELRDERLDWLNGAARLALDDLRLPNMGFLSGDPTNEPSCLIPRRVIVPPRIEPLEEYAVVVVPPPDGFLLGFRRSSPNHIFKFENRLPFKAFFEPAALRLFEEVEEIVLKVSWEADAVKDCPTGEEVERGGDEGSEVTFGGGVEARLIGKLTDGGEGRSFRSEREGRGSSNATDDFR